MDLETFWKRLRPPRVDPAPQPKGWDLRKALLRAAQKAETDLEGRFEGLDPAVVSKVATTTLQCFLEAWYDELRGGDTVSLIGVVMAGADLDVAELKGFVAALPETLLQRICDFPTPVASGLQALLAIEHCRRKKTAPDYLLSRDALDGTLIATFYPPQAHGEPVTFKLDETFEGVVEIGVVSK